MSCINQTTWSTLYATISLYPVVPLKEPHMSINRLNMLGVDTLALPLGMASIRIRRMGT